MPRQKPIPATRALQRLIQGNRRFIKNRRTGLSIHRDSRRLLVKSRGPFAIILSCSDSRAPAEILFDQGLGDLFVIRVAGNVIAPSLVGSVEFAVAMTQAQLVIVMGHTQCGAIQATYDALTSTKSILTDNIHDIVERIQPAMIPLLSAAKNKIPRETLLRESMRANVRASTHHLRHGSRFLEEMVRKKKITIIGAEYCIETGEVDFFDLPRDYKST